MGIDLNQTTTYEQNKADSELIDRQILNIDYLDIENQIQPVANKQLWLNYDIQGIQTTYKEILEMIHFFKESSIQKWCDLGAGYGRLGFVVGVVCEPSEFIGLEYAQLRVNEANRLYKLMDLSQCRLVQADLADEHFDLPLSEVYFIYDFGSRPDVEIVLKKLQVIAASHKIIVIARGRAVRRWILSDYPWLGQVNSPQHFENWSVFYS